MSIRVGRFLAGLLVLLSAAGCASSGGPYVWIKDYAPAASQSDFAIAVGDLISVNTFGNDRLSVRSRVRSDGKISVPLLNDVQAAGRAPAEVAAEIEKRFKEADLVLNPRVTVLVEEVRPITVAVLGAVGRAGTYTLDPTAGLPEALAAAGGLTEFAKKDRIFVVRRTPPPPVRIRFTFESITSATGPAALFRLRAGDVIVAE